MSSGDEAGPGVGVRSGGRARAGGSAVQVRPGGSVAGVLVCDKPAGITSHDVVAGVRREYRGAKVGHAGTLDPFATGVLLVLVGRATRLQRYLLGLEKTYRATARLGWRSSTGDSDGELERTGRRPRRLELPVGPVTQTVPMTSAVRVGGERLYRKAHRGERVERPSREVEIIRAELVSSDGDRAEFEIECSSGTYVRTLIETLGDAYCEQLRRIAVGPIGIGMAGERLSPAAALGHLPRLELGDEEAREIGFGRPIAARPPDREGRGDAVALLRRHTLVAVARPQGRELKPEVVMEPAG